MTPAAHGAIPSIRCDVREGLTALRREWIVGRGDVEEYEGRELQPIDDGYLTFDAANQARQKRKGAWKIFRHCAARLCAQRRVRA